MQYMSVFLTPERSTVLTASMASESDGIAKNMYVKISPRKTVPIIKCLFYFVPSFRSSLLAQHDVQ
jgi:hypothetical protein